MTRRCSKMVLIGLDGVCPEAILRLVEKGKLPTFKRLLDSGVFAENALAPYPTITPPNWTTIATGSWPGTHGITGFWVHNPGEPLDVTHCAVTTDFCHAEYLWNVAGKEGMKCIIMNYPTSYGADPPGSVVIAGSGLSLNESAIGIEEESSERLVCTVCNEQLFATDEYAHAATVEVEEAEGWKNLPGDEGDAYEVALPLYYPDARVPVTEERTWYLLLPETEGSCDRAILCKERDYNTRLAALEPGKWSERIVEEFETERGRVEAAFKVQLLELSDDGEMVRLYFTPVCQLSGWSVPEELAAELRDLPGLPMPGSRLASYSMGWMDADAHMDLYDIMHEWYVAAAAKLMASGEWNMFFMHAHAPDWLAHRILNESDEKINQDPESLRVHAGMMTRCYESIDRMIAEITEAAGEDALVVVVSDHGTAPGGGGIPLRKVLQEAGLLAYREDGSVDWAKTRAVPQRVSYVYLNVKGRDPEGIVEPGEEYERVRDEVIDLLRNYVDPKTGLRPMALVLKREDARVLGIYGDIIGDIVYALRPPYGGVHGQRLTTAKRGTASLNPLIIMAGPYLKKGVRLKRNFWLQDLVPTICHIMELPVPEHTEGAVIHQALENPELDREERGELKRSYEELLSNYNSATLGGA